MTKIVYRSIKSLPECDRPREKMLKLGPSALSDCELLAILVETGIKQTSALDLAREILDQFQSVTALSHVTVEELCSIPGIGPAKAMKVKAGLELANRCMARDIARREQINGPEDVYDLLRFRFLGENREHFAVLLMNTKNHLLKVEVVSIGSLDTSIVHPREVFSYAIKASSAAVILVHNHPSGNPEPSTEDKNLTSRLIKAGELLGISVLDHIIIGANDFFSFAKEQLI